MIINTRHYTRSSSLKMALFFSLLLGVSACILGYFIYTFSARSFIRETDASLTSEMEKMREWHEIGGLSAIKHLLSLHHSDTEKTLYLLWDSKGNKAGGNLPSMPESPDILAEGLLQFEYKHRLFAARVLTFSDNSRLLIARDIQEISADFYRMEMLSILIIILMAIVIIFSFLISAFVVKRTNLIAQTAHDIIATSDLSRRISLDSEWDDLGYMAKTLNALLDRIETLMQGIRQVSDNIAHDLRTPLTRLKNKLEESGADSLLIAEADHLLTTFSALLRISNLEIGKRHASFAPVDLATLLLDVVDLYEPLAEESQKTLMLEKTTAKSIEGDRDLLFQMLVNLLDNAIKYTPSGGYISVVLDASEIRISDNGIGVPEADKKRVFERFYRTDQSRHSKGTGLGLSLVAAIAEIHNFKIVLEDNHPGLRVRVIL